ncbi:DDE-domain-containing protein [Gyrodon lividus]|nr:DDE-domain-containing protein [Gyrodon lividus]
MPLDAQAIIAYASDVTGISIGSSWVKRFKLCHPDLWVKELVTEYGISMENIYNMDEKGIQLGIGAFIDHDQATVYNIKHGNRKLVTVIETSSTKGHIMTLSDHKITTVMPGWTDQELGLKWLQKDFEPQTAQQNQSDGYRLLILDVHNSHGTYKFCKFAAGHRIIIILCLPSHTTHVLQPLDVGILVH